MNRATSSSGQHAPEADLVSEPVGIPEALREVYRHMSPRRRRQFLSLLALMLVGGFAELGTIGSVIPFLAFLSSKSGAIHLPWPATMFVSIGDWLRLDSVVAAAIVFIGFAILAGAVRLQLTWMSQDFIYRLGHELAANTLKRILFQPYSFHIHRNTSTLISMVEKIEILSFDLLLPLMQTMIASVIASFIIAALLIIDPVTAMVAAVVFSGIYVLVSAVTRRALAENSAVVGWGFHERLKIIQESLGGIRDVIIDHSQAMYLGLFNEVNGTLARARATTAFIGMAPRYIVEGVGMVVIAGAALLISARPGGIGLALPFLGAIALGAQRLLPLLQNVYNGWSTAAGHRSIIAQVITSLRLPLPADQSGRAVPIRERISVVGVSYTYPTRRDAPALRDINFDIPAGSTVALVGETGSGKSTLADILMGLLEPTEGEVRIDGTVLSAHNSPSWQENIAHVPQTIFLADATIAQNIALSVSDKPVDLARAVEASRRAQLHQFVETLRAGYDTIVGERGVRLSGGQRQRLGIARAIYKQTPVLVLDEATSALDEATEKALLDALDQLRDQGRTLIIIAHRLSTIARCDLIVRLHDGRIAEPAQPEAAGRSPRRQARPRPSK
jgi:ATP-binding cassette subfamily B protein